jgi:hypothetical protein
MAGFDALHAPQNAEANLMNIVAVGFAFDCSTSCLSGPRAW